MRVIGHGVLLRVFSFTGPIRGYGHCQVFMFLGLSVVIAGLYINTEFNVLKDTAVPFITLTVSSVSHL